MSPEEPIEPRRAGRLRWPGGGGLAAVTLALAVVIGIQIGGVRGEQVGVFPIAGGRRQAITLQVDTVAEFSLEDLEVCEGRLSG